jgi:hypothetical protein
MKKFLTIIIITIVLFTAFGVNQSPVYAQAYDTDFVSMIHYQNVGTSDATINITIYDNDGIEAASAPVATLAPGGATSLYAGTLGLTAGFSGSAVISSDQPLASVVAQIGSGAVLNQPLSSGFSGGSSSVLIPTVLKNMFFFHTVFSVQNVDSVPADLTFTFVPLVGNPPSAGTPIVYTVTGLPAYASKLIDMGSFPEISEPQFNGSVAIEAVQTGTSTPGSVVATSMELEIAGNNAYAFDGASSTADKIYMPSAVCKFGPNNESTTAYAVQNTTSNTISVTVTYSNGNVDGPYQLPAYAKRSFDGCQANNPVGFLGSAVVESTGGDIHVVGKVYGGGLYPAHLAFISGSSKVALPFVRWTETNWENREGQRTFIAVQNIGTSDIPAGQVTVSYLDKDGTVLGTHTLGAIPVSQKANTHPHHIGAAGYEFGTYPDGSSGGGAIVEGPAGSQLAVVVRVQKYLGQGNSVGEDYTGIPIN